MYSGEQQASVQPGNSRSEEGGGGALYVRSETKNMKKDLREEKATCRRYSSTKKPVTARVLPTA